MREQEGTAAQESLIQQSDRIRDFVHMAVHDLREPLRAIRTGAEALSGMQLDGDPETVARCFRFIHQGADRLELLIRDLAEYCYLETRELELGDLEMEDVLREASKDCAMELTNHSATITHDPLPAVTGDFHALTAVLSAMLGNACKFKNSVAPQIHVGAEREGPDWVISVRDNGLGFSPAYRDRVFRPFERLNGKQYPGSGLGLALAKRTIERHGGRIWAETAPGQGSTFRFTLPAA